jgi:hypothetical protein
MQGGWFHAPTASWECMTSCIRYLQKPLLILYGVGCFFESLKNLPFPVLRILQNQRIAGSGSLEKNSRIEEMPVRVLPKASKK